jgi:hypothetical protein
VFQSEDDYLPLLEQIKSIRQGVIGEKNSSTLVPYFICQPESPHIESINITTLSCDQILAHFIAFLGSFMSDTDIELMQEIIFVVCSIRFTLNHRGYQRRADKIDEIICKLYEKDPGRGSSTNSTNDSKTILSGSVELDVRHEIELLQREKYNTKFEYCTNSRCSIEIFIDLIPHFVTEVFPASLSRMIK